MKNRFLVGWGDGLVLLLGVITVGWLWASWWNHPPAGKVRIRAGNQVFATLSLNQQRVLDVPGPLGTSHVVIANGKVRVASDPGIHQYCVKQGWLSQSGQVAMCLANRVSVELLGEKRYDSLNY